ncbi:MAG: DinB family protein [Bryobacterales bacterium]|nr:DinB family protein [Bryobacteraceae bacterium]MDW8129748.1 DinB family protein [Bryobacterales bacterium]
MQPAEARLLLSVLVPQLKEEIATTHKVLAAVPPGKEDYRPHPSSKSALELAWHLASSDWWFLDCIVRGEFQAGESGIPNEIRSAADVLAWYDRNVPPMLERLENLTDEELTRPVPFFGLMTWPAVRYLLIMMLHAVHHRGQLSSYLRPMGGKVPAIYGGSADEPMQPPA